MKKLGVREVGAIIFISHHSLASDQTTGKEHNCTHQQKIGLKIY